MFVAAVLLHYCLLTTFHFLSLCVCLTVTFIVNTSPLLWLFYFVFMRTYSSTSFYLELRDICFRLGDRTWERNRDKSNGKNALQRAVSTTQTKLNYVRNAFVVYRQLFSSHLNVQICVSVLGVVIACVHWKSNSYNEWQRARDIE